MANRRGFTRYQNTRRFATRSFHRAKNYGSSYAKGIGINASLPFLAGVAIGITNLDDVIPKTATIAVACAPVKGIGAIKAAAQGTIIGNLLQSKFGLNIGSGLGSSAGFKGV